MRKVEIQKRVQVQMSGNLNWKKMRKHAQEALEKVRESMKKTNDRKRNRTEFEKEIGCG